MSEIEPLETPTSLDTITRQKRGDKPLVSIDPAIIEDDIKDYKKDMKKHLKELKQLLEEDKLKYEEKKRKNKLRLLQLKKKQELELAREAVDAVSKVRKNETESGIHLLENLRMIKEDLQRKKDKLDKLLMEDLKNQKEERKGGLKSKSQARFGKQDSLNKMDKNQNGPDERTIIVRTTPNDVQRSENLRTSDYKNSAEVKVVKRSIFDGRSVFGNYLPLTPELRMWKPADIISMKRDINPFSTNKLIPPNDLHIFKNIFDQNSFLNMRKRRSIDSSIENHENEIDVDFNEIKKESKRFWPDKTLNNGDLKFLLPNQDEFEIQENDGVTEIKFLHHDDVRHSNHHEPTGESFDRYKAEADKDFSKYEEEFENAIIKDKEPNDTGVTEDSLFSYLFTNKPSNGLFGKSNSKNFMKDTTVNRENVNDFDPTFEENKPNDLEVTEDSLFSYLFEETPSEESQMKKHIGEVETKNKKYHDFLNHEGFGKPKDNTATYETLFPPHRNNVFLKYGIKEEKSDEISPDEDKDVAEKETPKDSVVTGKTLVSFLLNDEPPENNTTDLLGKQIKNVTITTLKEIDNIQKIPLKQEQRMFGDLINNLTGFFSKLNRQIQNYVKQIMN